MCFWPALVALPGSGFLFGLGSRDVVSVLGFGISGDMGFWEIEMQMAPVSSM